VLSVLDKLLSNRDCLTLRNELLTDTPDAGSSLSVLDLLALYIAFLTAFNELLNLGVDVLTFGVDVLTFGVVALRILAGADLGLVAICIDEPCATLDLIDDLVADLVDADLVVAILVADDAGKGALLPFIINITFAWSGVPLRGEHHSFPLLKTFNASKYFINFYIYNIFYFTHIGLILVYILNLDKI
jgi:hypothetical protein